MGRGLTTLFALALCAAARADFDGGDVWSDVIDDVATEEDIDFNERMLNAHAMGSGGSGSQGSGSGSGSGYGSATSGSHAGTKKPATVTTAAPTLAPVSPTPAPTLAAGTKAVVVPTSLTGFSVAEFKGGLQFAYRKSIATLTKVDISKVVISNVRAGSRRRLNEGRRLAAADSVKFDLKIQVANAAAATAMTTSVKAITPAALKTSFVAEATKVKSGAYGVFTGDPINSINIATRAAAIVVAPDTAAIKTETVVAPVVTPVAKESSGVGAIVGGIVGAIVVGGGAWYFMNNKGKGSVTPS